MVQAFFHNMLIIIGFIFISFRLNDLIYKKIEYDWLRIIVFSILAVIQSSLTMIEPFKYKDMYFDIRSIPVFLLHMHIAEKLD